MNWLVFSYSLPAEPSSKRVLVWRHLRKLGAMLDTGVWLLPETPTMTTGLKEIVAEVSELGGRTLSFRAEDFSSSQTEALRQSFNELRREEYGELLIRCQRFLGHVQRLLDESDLKFGSLEEMEEDLEKRRRSFTQISSRDVFQIDERAQLEASIHDCEVALANYSERVYLAGQDRKDG